MNALCLDDLRECMEGGTPAIIATCAPDGTPNASYLSQIQYVDDAHLALSFQFFNKTRVNVIANPQARLLLIHPESAAVFSVQLRYLRTESEGALFEAMRARLASIASHSGMSDVFRLRGADVYRVLSIEAAHPGAPELVAAKPNRLGALRASAERLARHWELDALLGELLACLLHRFSIMHAMVLMLDESGERLYTVASIGYPRSGVGSEIAVGAGVIGVAARARTPIRLSHASLEYAYGRAIRDEIAAGEAPPRLDTEIPLPGLADARSQLAVPIPCAGEVAGVLFVESPLERRFGWQDEDALVALCAQLGAQIHAVRVTHDHVAIEALDAREPDRRLDAARHRPTGQIDPIAAAPEPGPRAAAADAGTQGGTQGDAVALLVRHYRGDQSVFFGDEYLIKGVAGAIVWAMLSDFVASGRTVFSNRELRLDARVRLPEVSANLEARLLLLQRRLDERGACIRLERTGRGRMRLNVTRPIELRELD